MSRVGTLAALAATAWITCPGCDVPFPETASADCQVTVVHQRILSSVRSQAILVVIDPDLGRGLDDGRRTALTEALAGGVAALVTGDFDADGVRDFSPDETLRLAVITVEGAEVSGAPPPPTLASPEAMPVQDGFLEVWPGEDPNWDAWMVEAARARVAAALGARAPERSTPLAAARAFVTAHPDFVDGDWRPMLLVVSGRDDEPTDAAALEVWRQTFEPTTWAFGIVGGLLPMHIPEPGSLPDLDALLAGPGIDESAVRCEDGARVGVFPRRLLELARELSPSAPISLGSLCAPSMDFIDPLVLRITHESAGACLPRPLPTRPDGTVECRFEVTLPARGRGHRCAGHGLRQIGVVLDALGRPRERCALPVVPRDEIDSAPGIIYDDFSPELGDVCGWNRPRFVHTPRTDLPGGTTHEWWCAYGTAACGLDPDLAVPLVSPRDAGID